MKDNVQEIIFGRKDTAGGEALAETMSAGVEIEVSQNSCVGGGAAAKAESKVAVEAGARARARARARAGAGAGG